MAKSPDLGIDELRKAVRVLGGMNETFNQRFSAEELLKLCRACWASEWDITPDRWTEDQVQAALKGEVPRWEDCGKPVLPRMLVN